MGRKMGKIFICHSIRLQGTTLTRPKLRFPDVVFTKAHDLSYTCLIEDRAEYLQINEMCRKFCPIVHISYVHEIHIFV
jgi:hypothetical protein